MEKVITLKSELTLSNAFLFPLQSKQSRKELLIGALYLLIPIYGWLLNMGHRIVMVHRMQNGQSAWPAWTNNNTLFKHGFLTFLGMVQYHAPAAIFALIYWHTKQTPLLILAIVLWISATIIVPGYMTHYCYSYDWREIFDLRKAVSRVFQLGTPYFYAWGIALSALTLSLSGFFLLGLGFLVTSVWFWQVAGFYFATVFSQRFFLQNNNE
jgi:hypothetical protein